MKNRGMVLKVGESEIIHHGVEAGVVRYAEDDRGGMWAIKA